MKAALAKPAPSNKVMLIDDEPDNLCVLENLLSHAGYHMSVFRRGELALAAARADPPNLVMLDIRMPGMDGFEVCRSFKAEEALRKIPILFISGLSEAEDIAAGFECGGVDYIVRPFRAPEVLARVRTHLALQESYAQLTHQHSQLKALEQHRDTLVHMLAHDMRSPLQVIQGHLELLADTCSPLLTEEGSESLKAAIQGTRLLSRMVSAMIDINRMENNGLPLKPVPVTVDALFHAAAAHSFTPSERHRLTARIAASCPSLQCDIGMSERILVNLLSNAAKYSPCGSEIAFGAEPDPGGVKLWVRSSGAVIPPRLHKKIFEKFGVADQSSNRPALSTGLGLAFCKMAVEAQGGTIGLLSEPDTGNTFWFTLPSSPEA